MIYFFPKGRVNLNILTEVISELLEIFVVEPAFNLLPVGVGT